MLSPERKGRVTGSQAGAILGLSPWMTREDVIQEWLFGSIFVSNAATEYGSFHEEYALADLQLQIEGKCEPNQEFHIHREHNWLGCTPDGFVINKDDKAEYVIEIKCPFGLRNDEDPEFKLLEDMPHYYAQVQLEMYCTGVPRAVFFQWNRFKNNLQFIELDQQWIDENIPKLMQFMTEVDDRRATVGDDELLAGRYLAAKRAFDQAKELLDEAKEQLVQLAAGQKRKVGPVSVYPVTRKGSVSYAKVVKDHLPDLDLTPYTGEPSVSWVVK